MFFFTDDPAADFERYDAEQQEQLDKLPKCAKCGEPIQDDELYDIYGELYHEKCMVKLFRKWTDDYVAE